MKEKMKINLSKPKIIAIAVLCAFVLFYIGCQIYISVRGNEIRTEIALAGSAVRYVSAEVFVVRDERIISSGGSSIVSAVKDGERVSANDTVAYSFSDGTSAANVKRMSEISELLDYYDALMRKSTVTVSDTSAYDDAVMNSLYTFSGAVSSGDFSSLSEVKSDLRDAITSRQTATGVKLNLTSEMNKLRSEYNSLLSSAANYREIKSDGAGYYISGTDGYENILDWSKVDEWTVSDVAKAFASSPAPVSSLNAGRIVHGYTWYIVCMANTNEINSLSTGDRKKITFPDSAVQDITARIYDIRSDRDTGKSIIIFETNEMNSSLASLRRENAHINIAEYKGYRIDNRAIRVNEDNEKGVYVLSGSVARFKKMEIIYSNDDYSIVVNPAIEHPEDYDISDRSKFVNLYDEYIIEGLELEEGKIVQN